MPANLTFQLQHQLSGAQARSGILETAHGRFETPVFMPVATHGAVRGQFTETLNSLGYPVLLANTYHLLLRPGVEVFEAFGGIHHFMNWPGSILTDSGGFQMFSLSDTIKVSEQGAEFTSYIDGKKVLLTPETCIATQKSIGSDIMMVLDQCVAAGATLSEVEAALSLTSRWAVRSLEARGDSTQALFAIVQGGCNTDLREQSASQLTSLPFDGFAIGGVAVGEERQKRDEIVRFTASLLPNQKPRYLMGVGTPLDILEAVRSGMDMFDCILPNAWAQNGFCFTNLGKIDLRRSVYRLSKEPIAQGCACSTCTKHSRAYLHHLHKAGELVAGVLIGIHNLYFYQSMMQRIRHEIRNDSFDAYYESAKANFSRTDEEFPANRQPVRRSRTTTEAIGNYRLHRKADRVSIAHSSSGEIMHSVNDPLEEAEQIYIRQSRLRERLHQEGPQLILWDVGLGAATNAMSAVMAFEKLAKENRVNSALHIVSFENDLDSLRLALKHPGYFAQVQHAAPNELLQHGTWVSKYGRCSWELRAGEFLENLQESPTPDLIYYDPFSYKTNPDLWTLATFRKIAARCREGKTELFTYSSSTQVRAALLAADFYVARGAGTGPKEETTIAIYGAPKGEYARDMLDKTWLARWERSQKQMPLDINSPQAASEIASLIRTHPQF